MGYDVYRGPDASKRRIKDSEISISEKVAVDVGSDAMLVNKEAPDRLFCTYY